jgi:hypothetical protein
MPSSKLPTRMAAAASLGRWPLMQFLLFVVTFSLASLWANCALAQVQAQGFAVERFYPAAPGGGWMVMDELNMQGRLGGVVAISGGYAYKPLHVPNADGSQLDVVRHQAFADVGVAVTVDRYRICLNLTSPLLIKGQSGNVGAYQFTGPDVSVGKIPDLVSDARIGFDTRLVGNANSPFRFGLGAQLIIPNGNRSNYNTADTAGYFHNYYSYYNTDGAVRGMLRGLYAGDWGIFTTAAQLGVHIRTLNDSPIPGSPRGSELLYGIAAGPKFAVTSDKRVRAVIGPEIFGVTAFKSFLGSTTTAVEGLITGRIEGAGESGSQLRFKLSTGRGLHQQFGAPEWRVVFGVEMFDWKD